MCHSNGLFQLAGLYMTIGLLLAYINSPIPSSSTLLECKNACIYMYIFTIWLKCKPALLSPSGIQRNEILLLSTLVSMTAMLNFRHENALPAAKWERNANSPFASNVFEASFWQPSNRRVFTHGQQPEWSIAGWARVYCNIQRAKKNIRAYSETGDNWGLDSLLV